jgi:hypothetical protein
MAERESSKTTSKQSDDILLDSMIIHHILAGGNIVKNLQNIMNEYDSKFILLDKVNEEFKNMEQREYGKTYTDEHIEEKLSKIGMFEKISVDYENKEIIKAKIMYQSEKYYDLYGENISYVDYILLQVHITQALVSRPTSVLTEDWGLIRAADQEGRSTMKVNYSWNTKNWYCPGCRNTLHHKNHQKNLQCQNCGTMLKKIILDSS